MFKKKQKEIELNTTKTSTPKTTKPAETRQAKTYQAKKKSPWGWGVAIILCIILFGLYAFIPQIKSLWSKFAQGPSVVFSYLKEEPQENLKQTDGVTNVLLLGIDKRANVPFSYKTKTGTEEKNGFLADTIIIASIRHSDNSVVMLSLPRDLWVEVPAFNNVYKQSTRINAAYSIGDMYGYEGGGLALMQTVVSNILNIPIHYSARVDFEAVKQGVDLFDGVDVNVENTFDDYMYPREGYENAPNLYDRYIHVHFDQGVQHMDGTTALEYARSRHALGIEGSDFSRAKRQQKVVMALVEKVRQTGFVASIPKLSELLQTFGQHVETNMELKDMVLFYKLGQKVDLNQIKNYVLNNGDNEASLLYHPPEDQFGGAWILLPKGNNWIQVQAFVQKIFYTERLQSSETTPSSDVNNE